MYKSRVMNIVCIIVTIYLTQVEAGCYHEKLCCPGKNNSCTSEDDGIPRIPTYLPFSHHDDTIEYNNDIDGPDMMIQKFAKTTKAPTRFRFGAETVSKENPPSEVEYHSGIKSGEFQFLNKEIPYIAEYDDAEDGREKYDDDYEEQEDSRYRYFEKSKTSDYSLCYCDDYCIRYGDCCSDYSFVCPVRDCSVENWGIWSSCVPDDRSKKCGTGVQTRVRRVRQQATHGGQDCPPLVEKKTCFKKCRNQKSRENPNTAALLLDYAYHHIGEKQIDFEHRYVHKDVDVRQLSFYCITYKLNWVNHNCIDPNFKPKLYEGNIICAECQPDAQMHRPDARCAMELEDGESGFWKLLGPKSCNGLWERISRVDDCKCGKQFNGTDSFLLV